MNQVIRKLSDSMPWASAQFGQVRIIAISISIPRKIAPGELMHHLVRRLYERLLSEKIFGKPGTWRIHADVPESAASSVVGGQRG